MGNMAARPVGGRIAVDSSQSAARSNDRRRIAGAGRSRQQLACGDDPIVRTPTTGYEARMKNVASSDPGEFVGAAVQLEPPASPRRGGDRIQFFDCLRALAIFVVIVGHYRHDVFPGGSIGVSIFFALSGYLITSILLAEPVLDWHSAWRFIVRRFLRVWPPYLVSALMILALMFLAVWVLERQGVDSDTYRALVAREDEYWTKFPQQLLFLRNPSWLGMGVGVFWTLQIEFWFYVTIPILMLAVGRGRGLVAALLLALFCSLALRFIPSVNSTWLVASIAKISPLILHVARWFDTLLAGALVAVVARRDILEQLSKDQFSKLSVCCLGSLMFIVLFISNDDRQLVWPLIATVSGLITCVWILAFLRSGPEINFPIVAWFGRISYSVYLVHAIPLDYMRSLPWPAAKFLTYSRPITFLVAAILVAVLLHYLVEKPAIRAGKFLTRRQPRQASNAAGAAALEPS
jgi:peptidoglycan/LPS O-acetylase OafA/YrhL